MCGIKTLLVKFLSPHELQEGCYIISILCMRRGVWWREQGRLVVDEEDIRSLSIVACEGGWKVDEEVDARKVAWLTEMKDKLSLSIVWPV
jgi:hypothetical protein